MDVETKKEAKMHVLLSKSLDMLALPYELLASVLCDSCSKKLKL